MRIVVIESPYRSYSAFELQRNLAYARALVEHVTLRGDCPLVSHLLITQSLDDRVSEHRRMGILAGLEPLRIADLHSFGIDLGISDGMADAMLVARIGKVPVEEISLPAWKEAMACSSTAPLELLIDRYAPKWHVHEVRQ